MFYDMISGASLARGIGRSDLKVMVERSISAYDEANPVYNVYDREQKLKLTYALHDLLFRDRSSFYCTYKIESHIENLHNSMSNSWLDREDGLEYRTWVYPDLDSAISKHPSLIYNFSELVQIMTEVYSRSPQNWNSKLLDRSAYLKLLSKEILLLWDRPMTISIYMTATDIYSRLVSNFWNGAADLSLIQDFDYTTMCAILRDYYKFEEYERAVVLPISKK